MTPLRLLWAADRPVRRDRLFGALLAGSTELCAAGLLGVSGWFLATCAVVTLQLNTTWSWMYPSGTVRSLALGRTGLRYTERLTSHRAVLRATAALRARLVRGTAALPVGALRDQRDGTLLARLTTDVGSVSGAPAQVWSPLTGTALTAATVTALLLLASPAAGAAEALVLAAAVGSALLTDRRTGRHQQAAADSRATARTGLLSARATLAELACLDAVAAARAEVSQAVRRAEQSEEAAEDAVRLARLALRLLGALAQLAVLLLALSVPVLTQSAADAIGEVLLVAACYELTEALPQILRDHSLAVRAARRLSPLAVGPQRGLLPAAGAAPAAVLTVRELPVGLGRARDRWSTTIRPGEVVVVTGPNGSGKSTLLTTLAGRTGPSIAGCVLLGGTPVEQLSAGSVAGTLTLVEADDWIADTDIAANLRQAAPTATDAALHAALRTAALDTLPLDTPTGPLGSALSQGQRRRLTIARAVLRAPGILLLDEPTAGLDHPTVRRMLAGLRAALPHSALVIALPDQHHRLLPFPVTDTLRLAPPSQTSTAVAVLELAVGSARPPVPRCE